MQQISEETFFDKCIEKYEKEHKFTEDEVSVRIKEAVINKPNEKTNEIKEVEHLDSQITSISKSSPIIQQLYQKRKLRHEELMKKLTCELNDVNVKIEKSIRISSQEVKAHMKYYKEQLNEKINNLDTSEISAYHQTVFLDIQKEVDKMKSHQLKLIQELYDDLLKFEKDRSTEIERIFQSSFKEIEKTGYILPFELQNVIEQEALKMNQLALSNRRCYEDLKLNLTLVTEQTFKSFMDEVFCLKEKWYRYSQQEKFDTENKQLEKEFVYMPEPEKRIELKGHWLPLTDTADKCFSIVRADEWCRNVTDVSNVVENAKATVTDLYQQLMAAVQENLRNEYEELRKSLVCCDMLELEERTIQPIIFKIECSQDDNIQHAESRWQRFLQVANDELNNAYKCLKNFGELWNRHISRLCESKILVLRAVEKTAEINRFSLQELEVKVNLSLDALRQECNEENLDTLYIATIADLDDVKKKLESDYVAEVTVIEDYYKMMNLEADVLSSEIKEFIFLNWLEIPEAEEQFIEVVPEFDESETDSIVYCIQMERLLSEVKFLKFYKNELRNALENLAANTRERVASRAEDWVTSKANELSRKYQTILEMHLKRYDRIRIQIYEVRKQEIHIHQRVFDEHKAGVEDFYNKAMKMIEGYYEKYTEKLEENRSKVSSSIADINQETRASAVRCTQTQIQTQKDDFLTELTLKAEETNQEIQMRASSIQQSNLKFMKSIKLFHENGNYDVDEAKSYVASLENIDKEIRNEVKSMTRDLKKRETELLHETSEFFDETIRMLIQLNEELQFYANVKNVVQLCKNDLCTLLTSLKADFDFLNKYSDYIQKSIADEKSFLCEREDRLWFLVIAALHKNINNLFYTLEVPQWLEHTWKEITGNDSERKKFGTSQRKEKDEKLDFPPRNFKEEIFNETLLTDDTGLFMGVLCEKCSVHMDDLQRLGYAFYQRMGRKSLIKRDLLQSNYEEFGNEVCKLFHFFAFECETVWLQMAHDLLPILGNIKTWLKNYFERRVREYGVVIISNLDNFYSEVTNSFSKNVCNMLSQLLILDNKLLPLYGYSRNNPLLSSLEDEVVEKIAELELNWEMFIHNYMIKLKTIQELCTTNNVEYQNLKLLHTQCKDSLSVEKIGKYLIHFIDTILDKGGFIKKIQETSSDLPFRKILINTEVGKGVRQEKQKLKMLLHHLEWDLMDSDTYFAEIKKIIWRETSNDPLENTNDMKNEDWMNMCEPKLGLVKEIEAFEDIIAFQMKKIKTTYRDIKEFLQSKANVHQEILLEWLDRWKENLAEILKLYAVKYRQNDSTSDCTSQTNSNQGKNQ